MMETPLSGSLAALATLEKEHVTARGVVHGFLMADATAALGGLSQASDALLELMGQGLIDAVPVAIGGDVHTLYRVVSTPSRTLH